MNVYERIRRRLGQSQYEQDDPIFKKEQQALRKILKITKFYGKYPKAKEIVLTECKKLREEFGPWEASFAFLIFALFANSAHIRNDTKKNKNIVDQIKLLRQEQLLPDVITQTKQGMLHVGFGVQIAEGPSRHLLQEKLRSNGHILCPSTFDYQDNFGLRLTDIIYGGIHATLEKGPRISVDPTAEMEKLSRGIVINHLIDALRHGYQVYTE